MGALDGGFGRADLDQTALGKTMALLVPPAPAVAMAPPPAQIYQLRGQQQVIPDLGEISFGLNYDMSKPMAAPPLPGTLGNVEGRRGAYLQKPAGFVGKWGPGEFRFQDPKDFEKAMTPQYKEYVRRTRRAVPTRTVLQQRQRQRQHQKKKKKQK